MEKTACDAILQFGIWQEVQTRDEYTYQRVINKVFTQNKVLDNTANFNWSQAFSGLVPPEFNPIGIPMKWDGTFNVSGNKRKYFSEAVADQFSDNEFYHRNYEQIARTASPQIVAAWSNCIASLNNSRGIRCEVSFPEIIPDNDEPISIRIDITKYTTIGDRGTDVYLSKDRIIETLEAQDLKLRSDSFIERRILLREGMPKRIIVNVPPSKRGKVIDLPITTSVDVYSGWVSFIAPLSAESPTKFSPPVEVSNVRGGECYYTIQNDAGSRLISRIHARFACKNIDLGPLSRGDVRFRIIDRTDGSTVNAISAVIVGRGYHFRDIVTDIHVSPRSSRDILAQIFDGHSMADETFEITLIRSDSFIHA